jgi:hypothetical protein
MNLPLVSGVVLAINNIPVVTNTRVSVKRARNVTQKYGALGPIGSAPGQFKISGTLTLAVPKAGMEIDIDALSASETGFSVTFQKGLNRYLITGSHIADDGLENDPESGNTDNVVNFVATELIPIS